MNALLLGLVLAFSPATATVDEEPTVDVALIPEVKTFEPGKPFDVAIRVRISDPWHTYWTNPGDSGLAPSAKWQLPAGVTVSPLRLPAPHRIESPGTITFGYEKEVVFLATVTTRPNVRGPLNLRGTLDLLVCHESCIAKQSPLTATVSAGKATMSPDAVTIFQSTRASLPVGLPKDAQAAARRSKDGKGVELVVNNLTGDGFDFFALDGGAFASARPVVKQAGQAATLMLAFAQIQTSDPNRLKGVLRTGKNAYWVDLPISR